MTWKLESTLVVYIFWWGPHFVLRVHVFWTKGLHNNKISCSVTSHSVVILLGGTWWHPRIVEKNETTLLPPTTALDFNMPPILSFNDLLLWCPHCAGTIQVKKCCGTSNPANKDRWYKQVSRSTMNKWRDGHSQKLYSAIILGLIASPMVIF